MSLLLAPQGARQVHVVAAPRAEAVEQRALSLIGVTFFVLAAFIAFESIRSMIANEEPANEGKFRPLKLILPEGKILSAHPTAPMGNYSQPFPTVIDAIIKALEHALPRRGIAGDGACLDHGCTLPVLADGLVVIERRVGGDGERG